MMSASEMKETVKGWWADRYLPPSGHEAWFLIKAAAAIGGVVLMATHGSVHMQDAAGVAGAGVGGWLLKSVFGKGDHS